MTEAAAHTGRPTPRIEDARLLTGQAQWTDTRRAAGVLHLAVVRSPLAHARITHVDVSQAPKRPGVVAAYSGADLADMWREPLPVTPADGAYIPAYWPLAADKVRFAGEGVAVVVAESREQAADALEAVEVDYEPLTPVPTLQAALTDETLVHEHAGTNVAFSHDRRAKGDVEKAFADADVFIERQYTQQRVVSAPLETRATLAVPESPGDGGGLAVYTSTQVPGRIRDTIADMLGLAPERVRVDAKDVGGGFGAKLHSYPEDLLCAALALRLRRPVRYSATRSEDMQTTNHGRAQLQHIKVGARADGTLLGLQVRVIGDCGAYLSRNITLVTLNGDQMFTGCYRWPAYRFAATGMFTTATPVGAYRGAGRPEAIFGVERAIDDLAAALGMDPADLRRRNFPSPAEFPFASAGGLTFESGDYGRALDAALGAVGYEQLRAEQARRRASGDAVLLGIGLSSWLDRCGAGREYGAVRIRRGGRVEVVTGLAPSGQGTATSLAQIAADALDIDPAGVTVIASDTALVPDGLGTFGSRSMPVGAAAVQIAAGDVAGKARRIAADLLEANPDDVVINHGRLGVRGSPETALTLAEVAAAAEAGEAPDGMARTLEAEVRFKPEGLTFPYGTHVAVVEVDTETGDVALRRFAAVDDVGNVINPALMDGQRHGGIAQGIGQALYEEALYDADGNLTTGTLVDYLIPAAPDLPDYELGRIGTASRQNPLGVKGAGEAGAIGATPAVVNAIVDALRHLGVDDVPMPCTPQRVWQAIRAAARRR